MIFIAFILLSIATISIAMEKEDLRLRSNSDREASSNRESSARCKTLVDKVHENFFRAVTNKQYDTVSFYLKEKLVDIDKPDSSNTCNALQWSAEVDDIKMLNLLLESGASINSANNKNKHTVLTYAVWHASHRTVKHLLQRGALVNKQNGFGQTSLHYAVEFKRLKKVELLLEYKANAEIADEQGITAWELVKSKYRELPSWYHDSDGQRIMELIEWEIKKSKKEQEIKQKEAIKLHASLRIKEPLKQKEPVTEVIKEIKKKGRRESDTALVSTSASNLDSTINKIEK